MERNINRYGARRRSRVSRAVSMLVALVLMITIAPMASAMSPVAEIDTVALSSEDVGTGVLLEDDIAEKLREILEREYNPWDLWSAPANPAPASEQEVDDLFAHMEQYPALYSQASNAGIEPGSDGSNTLDDYRSPRSSATTGRAIHPTLGEGFFSGVLDPSHGAVRSDDRADTLDNLAATYAVENDGNVTRAEDFQFIEQNVDFGAAAKSDGNITAEDFQFIEQNTLLPVQGPATGDGPPVYTGQSELGYQY
jgi:hypothetical protein